MKVLVVGGGGREHAIISKLAESPLIDKLYCAPGNGGIGELAECVNISTTDVKKLASWAKTNGMDYVVVAPDDPLCLGLVDMLEKRGIPAFGPNKAAAKIEGSKVYAKKLMAQNDIPTAPFAIFTEMSAALSYIAGTDPPMVVKADGLALGKGVIICQTRAEGAQAVRDMMENNKFGASGKRVVVEKFLTGPEVSVLTFTDGKTIVPMVSSMDHKRALDGDEGLNTGGMGVVAPNPYYTEEIAKQCMEDIFIPTVKVLSESGAPFKGCLYFGLMLTNDGPRVIEYNCRFGDPEAQAVLPLLKSDLFSIMRHVTAGTLDQADVRFSDGASCCVVMASGGYPLHYEKGMEITGLPEAKALPDISVFHAGTCLGANRRKGERRWFQRRCGKQSNEPNAAERRAGEDRRKGERRKHDLGGPIVTNGGRVLGVTAVAETLETAIAKAYEAADLIVFEGAHMRRDIGQKALAADGQKAE